ncbi:MAG: GNAT family N-acetyltransferase [Gemmataceae bacterium]
MSEPSMPVVRLKIPIEQFHQLPQHPAYKYEYIDGKALLTPRPKFYHALLDLHALAATPAWEKECLEVTIQPLQPDKLFDLAPLFMGAFHRQLPFANLIDDQREAAARKALEKVAQGGDGPWIVPASFVAWEQEHEVGAILVTLLPHGDLSDWHGYHWRDTPPKDCIEKCLGRPHVTWIFVSPWLAGHGIGTALLHAAGNKLLEMGYSELASTFMAGNDSSMLWHWRNGFRLLPYPGSWRVMHKRIEERKA